MEDVIYEVIGGAVILGIIIIVISVFRSSNDVIRNSAENQASLDSIAIEDTIGYSGAMYNGTKVKEAMAYADLTPGVEVYYNKVKDASLDYYNNKSEAVKDTLKEDFLDKLDEKYLLTIKYYSTPSPANNAAPDRVKGDLDIVTIRFCFERK